MTIAEENRSESRPFEADVARLLQLMVHSVYSEKSVFLRELIANAADACERLRYEAVADVIGVPVGTVRSRLSRGREALRRLMGSVPDHQAEAAMARPLPPRAA